MEKIIIKNLKINANHGVFQEEKDNGQLFVLDVIAQTDSELAQNTDNLEHTVSYADMIETVMKVFTAESYNLLEFVSKKVATELLREYKKLKWVSVTVKKPDAPIEADFEYVAVENTLSREDLAK